MNQYHKINTVFKRDQNTKHKNLLMWDWAMPEFELLKNIEWVGTEKVDGTNIRVIWNGNIVQFAGKTDAAVIPAPLLTVLEEKFTAEKMVECFGVKEVCLYGEGYGYKIQMPVGARYRMISTDFILFDVKVGRWWLDTNSVCGIAGQLGIEHVPVVYEGGLEGAIDKVKRGFKSFVSADSELIAEGLILKPKIELYARDGERIITKIKHKDFT